MVKTNQIKIRSKRVIAELDTWIYKGTARRIDHQDGCHDDTLTCLAMGVFVMTYSLKRNADNVAKTKLMLRAWASSADNGNDKKGIAGYSNRPKKKYPMPIYGGGGVNYNGSGYMSEYSWLLK